MARAKCKACGEWGDSKDMYKVVTGITRLVNKYYCDESCWQAEEDRKQKFKEDKNRVYDLICDMFGYEIQNDKFFDEWAKWNKLKSNEIIYKYIRENEQYLQQACDKSFKGEVQRIMYFSAILKNNLMDFKPKVEVKEKPKVVVEETIYEAPTQSLNKRRSLDDLEDMF